MGMIIANALTKRIDRGPWVEVGGGGPPRIDIATDPTGVWAPVANPFPSEVYGIEHANGYWVATGKYNSLATATDSSGPWTLRTTPFGATTGTWGIGYGNGYWVATNNAGRIATASGDPTGVWTLNPASFGALYVLFDVVYANGIWVTEFADYAGGGSHYKIATATDPSGVWTLRYVPITSNLFSLAYGNGYWVAGSTVIITATDPTSTWTSGSSALGGSSIWSIAYANGIWVAVGDDLKIATATDPSGAWTLRYSGSLGYRFYDVAYGNGYWVVVGQGGRRLYATDPTSTWTVSSGYGYPDLFEVKYG